MRKLTAWVLLFVLLFSGGEKASAKGEYKAFLLAEANSGIIIKEENADEQLKAAGMPRMMSCLLALEALSAGKVKLADEVAVSVNAAKKTGTRIFLDSGTSYSFEVLLRAAIMCSANDATAALAEHLCGSEEAFTELMNKRAKELGCSAVFCDPTGLNEGGLMSARDILKIACEIAKYPLYFQYSGTWMDTFVHKSGRETEMVNQNRLVKTEKIDGMASASSKEAGYCLAASLNAGASRFIAVIIGAENSNIRFQTVLNALNTANASYVIKTIAKKGSRIGKMEVSGARKDKYDVCAGEDLTLLLDKGTENSIERSIEFFEVEAPLFAGDEVGRLVIRIPGREAYSIPLILAENAEKESFGSILGELLRSFMNCEAAE